MQFDGLKRREFMSLLGGAAAAWPFAARAQQGERVRRIGVLMGQAANDPEGQARLAAFLQGLQELGWSVGRNVRIDIRWFAGNAADAHKYAAELVALAPDIILASTTPSVEALLQATRTVPIVFTVVSDPVGAGFVDSLARPGGAAVLRDPTMTAGIGQFAAIQTAAPSLGMEIVPVSVRDTNEIERAVAAFARVGNGGLIVTGSPLTALHRDLIIALTARHRLPTVYSNRFFVADGGLMAYGPDLIGQHRPAARYVDRILKGEKPADLAVQTPTKYELVINLKTAKALGLDIPAAVLARADEVIE
jgi:ABC-type uncharacterized transport system substrate-binding protein